MTHTQIFRYPRLVWTDWSSRSGDAYWVLSQLPLCSPFIDYRWPYLVSRRKPHPAKPESVFPRLSPKRLSLPSWTETQVSVTPSYKCLGPGDPSGCHGAPAVKSPQIRHKQPTPPSPLRSRGPLYLFRFALLRRLLTASFVRRGRGCLRSSTKPSAKQGDSSAMKSRINCPFTVSFGTNRQMLLTSLPRCVIALGVLLTLRAPLRIGAKTPCLILLLQLAPGCSASTPLPRPRSGLMPSSPAWDTISSFQLFSIGCTSRNAITSQRVIRSSPFKCASELKCRIVPCRNFTAQVCQKSRLFQLVHTYKLLS